MNAKSGIILKGDGAAYALHQLAREQMKQKLMKDIQFDVRVCGIEGWDYREYLRQLHEVIAYFDPCEVTNG